MKTQVEQVLDVVRRAVEYVDRHFCVSDHEKDPRLDEITSILKRALTIRPVYDTGELIIEYDLKSGRPLVNEESAQRYINREVEKALFEGEWEREFDLLYADNRDDILISRMNCTYQKKDTEPPGVDNPREARFMLEGRLQMYLEAEKKIVNALNLKGTQSQAF